MRASEARTGLSARPACHRSWLAYGTFSPLTPEVGAVCGKAARTDLCGGREVTRVPTAKKATSVVVQVFGRRADEAIPAHRRPASEKRQGTKSREVGHRRCSGRYGDFAAGSGLRRLERSGCDDRVSATRRRVRRYERGFWASRDKIGRATAGESRTLMRAWALPAESRPDWRSSLRWSIGGDGLMMCRS
jgi:hypothetical protein